MDNTVTHIIATTDATPTGPDRWMGHCRAHGSKQHRDLSFRVSGTKILLHCFAGCSLAAICESLGLELKDLFTDVLGQNSRPRKCQAPIVRIGRRAIAFRFELAGLDLRLRAQRIIEAGKNLDIAGLSDDELDRAIALAMQGHADLERAELFEDVADGLRDQDFSERKSREQQSCAA